MWGAHARMCKCMCVCTLCSTNILSLLYYTLFPHCIRGPLHRSHFAKMLHNSQVLKTVLLHVEMPNTH